LDEAIPMKKLADLSIHLLDDDEDDFRDEEEYEDAFISEIMDAKYEKTTTAEVAAQQTHLNESQRSRLAEMLGGFNTLFDGKLGYYPHQQVHLEVDDNAIPIHTRACF
jgi:hypothetical protein